MRGLKHKGDREVVEVYKVAPLVGAWIETEVVCDLHEDMFVAPLVGAWIETMNRRTLAR